MKRTQERIEHLAAEYVLGSLVGGARRRFERWMVDDHRVRQEVWFWEAQLGNLAGVVPGQEPPGRVWNAIESRLWPASPTVQTGRSWFWLWSALASSAAVAMLVILLAVPEPAPEPGYHLAGAIVPGENQAPLWLISERIQDNQLNLKPVAATRADFGKDYELWIVPEGETPISLGVIPVGGDVTVSLTPVTRKALQESRTLAISLEPAGGSPTGAPTGPILHMTRLVEI